MKSEQLQTVLDDSGINVFDPKDSLGHKSLYITLLQEAALRRYIPESHEGGIAVDVGCGYGRLSKVLSSLGWFTIGVDPSGRLISYAKSLNSNQSTHYCQGKLPDLPFRGRSVDIILLHNLLRALKLMGKIELVCAISKYLSPKGCIVVVDNVRYGHPQFFTDNELTSLFTAQGLTLTSRYPLRFGRWWVLYLIRYGLLPLSWLNGIASLELSLRRRYKGNPRFGYMNVMYQFEHHDAADGNANSVNP